MKKPLLLTTILLGILLLLAACGNKDENANDNQTTLERIKEKGVLIVGSSGDEPFAYINQETKEFDGIDAEVMKAIAENLGIEKVEMKQVKFENLLLELNNDAIDIVADGMYVTPERQKQALFTGNWYTESEALIAPSDTTIKGIDDLKGKTVGAQKGSVFLNLANQLKEEGKIDSVVVFGSQAELFLAVDTNKVDAGIVDAFVAAYDLQKETSMNLALVETYQPVNTGDIAAAVKSGDEEFAQVIDEELNKLKEDGTMAKIFEKYGVDSSHISPVVENE